jgi:foldase protein PrsA
VRSRWLLVLLLVALAAIVSACSSLGDGGADENRSEDVPANAIALVAGTPVPRAEFDRFFRQLEASFEAQGREFPQAGTPEYELLKNQVVDRLVQRVQFAKEAEGLGIAVADAEVEERLKELKNQFFQGDEARYKEELKRVGIVEKDVKADLRTNLINEKLFDRVTKDVRVGDEDVSTYYKENKDRFTRAESRAVAHILVATKAEAQQVREQLENGAKFADLAKDKSLDAQSAEDGGKLVACRGDTCETPLVKPFEDAAFGLETGEISAPIKTEFGWHVIKALGERKPERATPLREVRDTISEQLLKEKQYEVMSEWVKDARAGYSGQIAYAVGFEPAVNPSPLETTTTP